MRKNFDMDAAIRRALRESIEAHAHEWEPKFNTGVGPVGDDAPFDKKVSGDVNEGKDCEDCCPKCGKCPCECDKVNEGTIPGDSHEWEPGFETGVGEVGDDSPFTQAVNESLTDTNDWEDGSFGAGDHRKEGIAFADGGDECGNGVVATSQKNSGKVESSDNLSEEADEEGEDEGIGGGLAALGKAAWNGVKKAGKAIANTYNRGSQAQDIRRDRRERDAGQAKVDAYNQKYGMGQATAPQQGQGEKTAAQGEPQPATQTPQQGQGGQQQQGGQENNTAAMIKNQPNTLETSAASTPEEAVQKASPEAKQEVQAVYNQYQKAINGLLGFIKKQNPQLCKQAANVLKQYGVSYKEAQGWMEESVKTDDDIITEERDRFFNIMNRIEKLYD